MRLVMRPNYENLFNLILSAFICGGFPLLAMAEQVDSSLVIPLGTEGLSEQFEYLDHDEAFRIEPYLQLQTDYSEESNPSDAEVTDGLDRVNDLRIENRFSHRNRSRSQRRNTRYIILHTTEGNTESSMNSVRRDGAINYLVDPAGTVYRIIEHGKIASHAGRSMWSDLRNLNAHSVGIEIVGYHNRELPRVQLQAVRLLVRELKRIYELGDAQVLTHSMVAYGVPNRWHPRDHRGRKRCAMNVGNVPGRVSVGLATHPTSDPDVSAGRLVVGDPYLFEHLFGRQRQVALRSQSRATADQAAESTVIGAGRTAWDIARERYNDAGTLYRFPNGRVLRGNQISDWSAISAGTRVEFSGACPNGGCTADSADLNNESRFDGFREKKSHDQTAWALAGNSYQAATTIYFIPTQRGMYIRTGAELVAARDGSGGEGQARSDLVDRLPVGTRLLVGYVDGGTVSTDRTVLSIAGREWDSNSTVYYVPPGRFVFGDQLNAARIPLGTRIFFAR